jgi:hypothetical protein
MNGNWIVRWITRIVIAIVVGSLGLSGGVGAPASASQMVTVDFEPQVASPITYGLDDQDIDLDAQNDRRQVWHDRGIRFKGPWQPEEMALALDILDAFGEVVGDDERLVAILEAAVRAKSFGFKRHLTLERKSSWGLPAAVWYGLPGKIVLNDSLFDAQFVYDNYYWSFLEGAYVTLEREISMQEAIIAHEIGHVFIDGLHAEARSEGDRDLSLEALYDAVVPSEQLPHTGYVTNENLATEFGVWALGIGRTTEVDALRTRLVVRFDAGVAAVP